MDTASRNLLDGLAPTDRDHVSVACLSQPVSILGVVPANDSDSLLSLGLTVELSVQPVDDLVETLPEHRRGQRHRVAVDLVEEQRVEGAILGAFPFHNSQGRVALVGSECDEQLALGNPDFPQLDLVDVPLLKHGAIRGQ